MVRRTSDEEQANGEKQINTHKCFVFFTIRAVYSGVDMPWVVSTILAFFISAFYPLRICSLSLAMHLQHLFCSSVGINACELPSCSLRPPGLLCCSGPVSSLPNYRRGGALALCISCKGCQEHWGGQ